MNMREQEEFLDQQDPRDPWLDWIAIGVTVAICAAVSAVGFYLWCY